MQRAQPGRATTYYVVTDAHLRFLAANSHGEPVASIRWTTDEPRAWFTLDYQEALWIAFLAEGRAEPRVAYE